MQVLPARATEVYRKVLNMQIAPIHIKYMLHLVYPASVGQTQCDVVPLRLYCSENEK